MITLVTREAVVAVAGQEPGEPIIGIVNSRMNGHMLSVDYTISNATPVELNLYNLAGKRVASLLNCGRNSSEHSFTVNFSGISNGTYVGALKTGMVNSTQRVGILK